MRHFPFHAPHFLKEFIQEIAEHIHPEDIEQFRTKATSALDRFVTHGFESAKSEINELKGRKEQ